MNDTCVYFHKLIHNNEVFYVGIGNKDRPKSVRRNKLWHSITKHNQYVIEIVHENLSWEDACILEIYYIKKFGRKNKRTGTLVNLTDGGDGCKGLIFSEDHKKKISAALKGKPLKESTKIKISKTLKGKTLTDSHKENISINTKNRIFSKQHRKNLSDKHHSKIKLNNNVINDIKQHILNKSYSIDDIVNKFNISKSTYYKIKDTLNSVPNRNNTCFSAFRRNMIIDMINLDHSFSDIKYYTSISSRSYRRIKKNNKLK